MLDDKPTRKARDLYLVGRDGPAYAIDDETAIKVVDGSETSM